MLAGGRALKHDPERHHRRSIRLKGYDYRQAGAYFVTIVTQDRMSLFGEVVDGVMRLNDAGRMVQTAWEDISLFYPGVDVDAFVVMPNHMHGIIRLTGNVAPDPEGGCDVGAGPRARPLVADRPNPDGQPRGVAPTIAMNDRLSLADVVGRFKSLTSRRYTEGVGQSGWIPYRGRVWQRNYYEHIIRDEMSLHRIRAYISDNPSGWTLDAENPEVARKGTHR